MDFFEFDRAEGVELLCGVDEAGRGPLAGDVYAAAVILPPGCVLPGLNDSKKLSPKRREALYDQITEQAVAWRVASATAEEIDKINILQATFLAMKRAVEGLAVRPALVLVDGNRNPRLGVHSRAVVKGDAKSAAIAAASILAKVSRDRYMEELAKQYPQYQFEKHKGYPTVLHYHLLDQYGPSLVHRKTFLKNYTPGDEHSTRQRGRAGEDFTTEYLAANGYEILCRNWICPYGELDIIARKDRIAAFVEVKARKENALVSGREAVGRSKQQKLAKAALVWLAENGTGLQPRFDVAEILLTNGNPPEVIQIEYIENAFDGGMNDAYL